MSEQTFTFTDEERAALIHALDLKAIHHRHHMVSNGDADDLARRLAHSLADRLAHTAEREAAAAAVAALDLDAILEGR